MYAYVRYLADGQKEIVPVEAITGFDAAKFQAKVDVNKKFRIKWNNELYEGTVVYIADTESELETKIEKSRPRIPPATLARTDDSDDGTPNSKKEVQNIIPIRAVLDRKRKALQDKHQNDSNKSSDNKNLDVVENGKRANLNTNCLIQKSSVNKNVKLDLVATQSQDIDTTPKSTKNNKTDSNKTSDNKNLDVVTQSQDIDTTPKSKQSYKIISTKRRSVDEDSDPFQKYKKKIKLLELQNTQLKQEISKLKQTKEESEGLIKDLTSLNMSLQKDILNEFSELKERVMNSNNDTTVQEQALPTGFIRKNTNMIHLGNDVWLPLPVYGSIKVQSKTASAFVKNLALAVFGIPILTSSTVSGKSSNRNNKGLPRQQLDPIKIMAIKAILRHWLVYDKKYDEPSADYETVKVTTYISKKIAEYQRKTKPSNKTVGEQIEEANAEEEDGEENKNSGDLSSNTDEEHEFNGDEYENNGKEYENSGGENENSGEENEN